MKSYPYVVKTYIGKVSDDVRGQEVVVVKVEHLSSSSSMNYDDCALPHIERHSPDGFNWGYCGSGPADLALSILTDYFGKDSEAVSYYQDFKSDIIAALPIDENWILEEKEIIAWWKGYKSGDVREKRRG